VAGATYWTTSALPAPWPWASAYPPGDPKRTLTAKRGSVISCTVLPDFQASVTFPTRPAPPTTGIPTSTPLEVPTFRRTVTAKLEVLSPTT